MQRLLVFLGGIAGAAGVALAAAGSHLASDLLGTAGTVVMAHAPALLAVGLGTTKNRLLSYAGLAIAAGLLLFAGDLAMRGLQGHALFPLAAPAGGILLILGWLGVALGAFVRRD